MSKQTTGTEKLTVSNLSKRFDKLEVLSGIHMTIRNGKFISFIGPSGPNRGSR